MFVQEGLFLMTEFEARLAQLFTPELLVVMAAFNLKMYTIRFVGGAIRDTLLGKQPHDIDLNTDCPGHEIASTCCASNLHYKVMHGGKEESELTTVIVWVKNRSPKG